MTKQQHKAYQKKIKDIKKQILEVSHIAQEGHLGSSFSVLDILFVLYDTVANISAKNLNSFNRDYIILSKGHASLAHAAVLAEKGFISREEFRSYCSFDSLLGGHLSRCSVPGVEVSTGSLGHGVSVSIGIALASKIKEINNKIYVVVGDGEINEGTCWESFLLASHHNLDNLYFIIDYNRSNDRALTLDPLDKKIAAFGFEVESVNGHCPDSLIRTLSQKSTGKPKAVIAHTIKGFGIKRMENNPEWHHKAPTKEDYIAFLEELS